MIGFSELTPVGIAVIATCVFLFYSGFYLIDYKNNKATISPFDFVYLVATPLLVLTLWIF